MNDYGIIADLIELARYSVVILIAAFVASAYARRKARTEFGDSMFPPTNRSPQIESQPNMAKNPCGKCGGKIWHMGTDASPIQLCARCSCGDSLCPWCSRAVTIEGGLGHCPRCDTDFEANVDNGVVY
jgi:hypothetical protein